MCLFENETVSLNILCLKMSNSERLEKLNRCLIGRNNIWGLELIDGQN